MKIGKLTRVAVFRMWALELPLSEIIIKTGLKENKLREALRTIPDGRLLPGTLIDKVAAFKTYERTGKPARMKMIDLKETAPTAAPSPGVVVAAKPAPPPPETPDDLIQSHREDWQKLRPLLWEAIEEKSKEKAQLAKIIAETYRITHDGERLAHGLPTSSGAAQGNSNGKDLTVRVVIENDPDQS
jgi:hypothetical protein